MNNSKSISEAWLLDIESEYLNIAVSCLEHLIKKNYDANKPVNVVEIGPMPTNPEYYSDYVAPISLLKQRNPHLNCISIGANTATDEYIKTVLGDVEYVLELLDPYDPVCTKKLLEKLGDSPDIIYGRNVFETSLSGPISLPRGPYKPFEVSAKILADGGFIVVDNADGKRQSVVDMKGWPNSEKMKEICSYMYGKNEGIYVFQK